MVVHCMDFWSSLKYLLLFSPVMMQATLKLSDDALMSDFYPECYHVVYKVYIATVSHNYFRQSGIQHWRHYKQAYVAFP